MSRGLVFAFLVVLLALTSTQSEAKVSVNKILSVQNLSMKDLAGISDQVAEQIRRLQEKVILFRRLLAAAEKNRGCLDDRDSRLEKAIEALEAGRLCKFAGLPPTYYDMLANKCGYKKAIHEESMKIRYQCNQYKGSRQNECRSTRLLPVTNKLLETQAICRRIGHGPDGPKTCPDLAVLKAAVDAIRKEDCGTGMYTYKEIVAELQKLIAKIKELLNGVPLPSNDPRFFNVPL